jgi:hypothetical protein
MEVSYGSYGIVYSNPRFPYYEKCFFDDNDLTYINEDYEDVKSMNEASKIFYEIDEYYFEQMNYKRLEKDNLSSTFFNKPLNYGSIDTKIILNPELNIIKDYKTRRLLGRNYLQITFPYGKLISNDPNLTIDLFYEKIKNILEAIKFLNDNHFLLDDFKFKNLLIVDDILKISDYNGMVKINRLYRLNFDNLLINSSYYFAYLPILNNILKYYICKKKNIKFNIEYGENKEKNNNYLFDTIKNIKKNFENYDLTITIEGFTFSINEILDEIKNYRSSDLNSKISLYFCKFVEYLNGKYKNINDIVINIIKRMNIYSFGIIILETFYFKNEYNYIISFEDSFQIKLLKIFAHCCLNFFIKDEQLIIFEPDINQIIELYQSL